MELFALRSLFLLYLFMSILNVCITRLLKKVDFITYPSQDADHRAARVVRRYVLQRPEDYGKYNRLCGQLRQLAHRLSLLDAEDPVRRRHEELLLEKLWDIGLLGSGMVFFLFSFSFLFPPSFRPCPFNFNFNLFFFSLFPTERIPSLSFLRERNI
jgi:hypothetical protein